MPDAPENQFKNQSFAKPVSLFEPDARALQQIEDSERTGDAAVERERVLAWASLIEFSALPEIKNIRNEKLRCDALEILTERARTDEDVCALVEFVLHHDEIIAKTRLVTAFQKVWERRPNRSSTIKMLHLAAESNDADLFLTVLTDAEQLIRAGKLADLTANELNNLADSHYWLLGEHARMSGAGFLLKQKLAERRL